MQGIIVIPTPSEGNSSLARRHSEAGIKQLMNDSIRIVVVNDIEGAFAEGDDEGVKIGPSRGETPCTGHWAGKPGRPENR